MAGRATLFAFFIPQILIGVYRKAGALSAVSELSDRFDILISLKHIAILTIDVIMAIMPYIRSVTVAPSMLSATNVNDISPLII